MSSPVRPMVCSGPPAGRHEAWDDSVPSSSEMERTANAPSCPPPLAEPDPRPLKRSPPELLAMGQRIDDFEVRGILGRGSFGVVYLARQVSLDRQVALKVSDSEGSEGRNMAQLEHEHIVQVFSETLDASGRRRLLCMQYVPGPTLDAVLQRLREMDRNQWRGAKLLEIVDGLTQFAATFDPASLRNRETLQRSDWIEAVCWIGARLAEALDYAHRHGVLHRDIKPANIMLSQYGRPMVVDFNLSFRPLEVPSGEGPIGGTLAYMAPEHLDAFNPDEPAGPEAVGPASDIYSLGVVLYELLTGRWPFENKVEAESHGEALRGLAAERRSGVPSLPPEFPPVLNRVIGRCLDPDPAHRYASGEELSAALEGCRQARAAENAIPARSRVRRTIERHPFAWLIALAVLPHVAASAVQISYNQIRIISHLTEAQQQVFGYLLAYNGIAYPIAIWLALRVIVPVYRVWRDAQASPRVDPARIDAARQISLTWPNWMAWLAVLGWASGGTIFPLGLALFAGPVPWLVQAHLITSFAISGLIALVYSSLFVQVLEVCIFYPRLWGDPRDFRRQAATELDPVSGRVRVYQVLAGLIPLSAAVLLLVASDQKASTAEFESFRFLVVALIILGMGGFQLAVLAAGLLSRAVAALAGR